MRRHPNRCMSRHGAITVEAAVVFPVFVVFLLGLIVGGMGVFCYQQVACQACEAARWASVRGGDYQRATDLPSPTQQQIFEQAVAPFMAGMDPAQIAIQVVWVDQGTGTAYPWDSAAKDVLSINGQGEYVTNTVCVTINYQWTPNILGIGSISLSSICEIPMSF